MTGDAVLPHHLPFPTLSRTLQTSDGHEFQFALYNEGLAEDAPMFVHFPAMGTRARNYRLLAGTLNQSGVAVALVDLRGHGNSNLRPDHQIDFGYREMLHHDWPLAVETAREYNGGRPVYLMGHSLGGQLSCAFAGVSSEKVAGLVLIASCSVYYRCFGWRSYPFRLLLSLVTPLVKMLGHFPGNIVGFARREAAQVMRDWKNQGITGRYEPKGDPRDYEAGMATLQRRMLILELEGDQLAPPAAVDHLLTKLPGCPQTRRTLPTPAHKHGTAAHFDWVKKPQPVAAAIMEWLAEEQQ